MECIRKATAADASRIAEILVFTKRMNYRHIFQDDKGSFGELQVLPLAQSYLADPKKLEHIWVYDDEIVKGMIHIEQDWIEELYVDHFFHAAGIGAKLIEFAIRKYRVRYLWVLEKNHGAIRFYQSHGFSQTQERRLQEGTTEWLIKMERLLPI